MPNAFASPGVRSCALVGGGWSHDAHPGSRAEFACWLPPLAVFPPAIPPVGSPGACVVVPSSDPLPALVFAATFASASRPVATAAIARGEAETANAGRTPETRATLFGRADARALTFCKYLTPKEKSPGGATGARARDSPFGG